MKETKGVDRHFTNAEIQVTNTFMRKYLFSLVTEKCTLKPQQDTTRLPKTETRYDTTDSMKEARLRVIHIMIPIIWCVKASHR